MILSSNIITNNTGKYSFSLFEKLFELCNTQTRLAQNNRMFRKAFDFYFFDALNGDFAHKINQLHERYLKDPKELDYIERVISQISNDEKLLKQCYNTLLNSLSLRQYELKYFSFALDAWRDVTYELLTLINLIKTNNIKNSSNPEKTEKYLQKLTAYDGRVSFDKFLVNYFFGGFKTPFANLMIKKYLILKTKQIVDNTGNKKWVNILKDDVDLDAQIDDKRTMQDANLKPIESTSGFGFDIDDISKFFIFWSSMNQDQKISLIHDAIKQNPKFSQIPLTKEIIKSAYSRISENLVAAEQVLRKINLSTNDSEKTLLFNKIQKLLSNDFIFREIVHQASEEADEISNDSVDFEGLYQGNRDILENTARKQYPVYKTSILYLDPFDLRETLKSPKLINGLDNPSLFFTNPGVRQLLINYLLGLAIINADSRYDYASTKSRKRAKGESFDELVEKFIDIEVDQLFKSSDDAQKNKVKNKLADYYWNNLSESQIRSYRAFANILHRDLATTNAIYQSGYVWGELTPEQINSITDMVVKTIYPIIKETNLRRRYKVMRNHKDAYVLDNIDFSQLKHLVSTEIARKNNAIKNQLSLHKGGQNSEQVDTKKLISDMMIKMDSILSQESDLLTENKTASVKINNTAFRGLIEPDNIRYSDYDLSNDIFAKWIIKNLK